MRTTGKEPSAALKPLLGRAKTESSIAPFFTPWFGAPPSADLKVWFSYIHQVGMGVCVLQTSFVSYIPKEPLSELHLLLRCPHPPPSPSPSPPLETVLPKVTMSSGSQITWTRLGSCLSWPLAVFGPSGRPVSGPQQVFNTCV